MSQFSTHKLFAHKCISESVTGLLQEAM